MRSFGFAMMVGIVLLLAGCGGGSATSVEYNSGNPPGISPAREKVRLEHQVVKRNDGASVACSQAESATEQHPWDCKVKPAGKSDTAEIEVLGPGFGGQYEITECRTSPNQRYSQTPKGICKGIH
jgi:hypothetical protein